MPPVLIAVIGAAASVVGFVAGVLFARARTRGRLERLAADQQTSVQLFLRRKVAEAGVDLDDLRQGHRFGEILAANVKMATALLTHERKTIEMGDTQEFGLASTMRLESQTGVPLPKEE
ncbi:MAG: hypothetical protein ABI333_27370 [bacterium]